MSLASEIEAAVRTVVNSDWNTRNGTVVPGTDNIALKNGAVLLDAVYLYADLADSTRLARDFNVKVAAKVIRSFLDASCRVIRARGGTITSFDGDRVMAIFVGDTKNSNAAKCALQINYAVKKVIRPAVTARFSTIRESGFVVSHCVGVAGVKPCSFEVVCVAATTSYRSVERRMLQLSLAMCETVNFTHTLLKVYTRTCWTRPRCRIRRICGHR